MSAGRRRGWWFHDVVEPTNEKDEDKDGRFESEGSERRVPSEGHAEGSDRTEV